MGDITSAREVLTLSPPQMLNQRERLTLMLGYIILLMDTGQYGILGTTDITDITSAKEVLTLSQKENLMPMPGSITLPMDPGQPGILDIMDMVDIPLGKRSADAKPEGKPDADAWLYYTTYG